MSDSKIIDGKALAQTREQVLKEKVAQLKRSPQVITILDINNPDSDKYTQMKVKKGEELGINIAPMRIDKSVDKEKVAQFIKEFSQRGDIDGVMIQLPLPYSEPETNDLIDLIDPQKDIDGLTGKGPYKQATIKGVFSILESIGVNPTFEGVVFGIVGSEGFVGRELAKTLEGEKGEIIKVDEKLDGTSLGDLERCDIVISCVGKEGLIKPENIKEKAVLIDVGRGDFDPSCYEKALRYTPKNGGVGPMTVISLMENIVDAASKNS